MCVFFSCLCLCCVCLLSLGAGVYAPRRLFLAHAMVAPEEGFIYTGIALFLFLQRANEARTNAHGFGDTVFCACACSENRSGAERATAAKEDGVSHTRVELVPLIGCADQEMGSAFVVVVGRVIAGRVAAMEVK